MKLEAFKHQIRGATPQKGLENKVGIVIMRFLQVRYNFVIVCFKYFILANFIWISYWLLNRINFEFEYFK